MTNNYRVKHGLIMRCLLKLEKDALKRTCESFVSSLSHSKGTDVYNYIIDNFDSIEFFHLAFHNRRHRLDVLDSRKIRITGGISSGLEMAISNHI